MSRHGSGSAALRRSRALQVGLVLFASGLVVVTSLLNMYLSPNRQFAAHAAPTFALPSPDGARPRARVQGENESTDWQPSYTSAACIAHRTMPVGRASDHRVGQGQRAACTDFPDPGSAFESDELRKEIAGSVDVSLSHRVIYIPVMKVGTQMFAEVLARRFGAVRMLDRDVSRFLLRHRLKLKDFFVFTIVRSPLSIFRSAYGEMSLYAAHGKILAAGFALIPQTAENEPRRAMECLRNVRAGVFAGLVPAHLFTQVWKTQRCIGKDRLPLELDFIGALLFASFFLTHRRGLTRPGGRPLGKH